MGYLQFMLIGCYQFYKMSFTHTCIPLVNSFIVIHFSNLHLARKDILQILYANINEDKLFCKVHEVEDLEYFRKQGGTQP